jgi:hypothetical protein
MGGVVVIALLALVIGRVVVPAVRLLRVPRAGAERDRAAVVLAHAIRGLPAERADWGQAMLGELAVAQGSRARWSFSAGCVTTAMSLRIRAGLGGSHRDGAVARAIVLAAVAAVLALAGYGLVRYPLVGSVEPTGAGVLALSVVLLGYVLCALTLSRGMTPGAVLARRYGMLGGVAVAAAWLVAIFPTAALKEWVLAPLAIAMLGPAGLAVLVRRATGDARAAAAAAVWCGLVGGLLVFVIWVTATYLQDGRPFDPQLIRDFRASGASDLTAYAIADNLGGALGMLAVVPTVSLCLGSIAARAAGGPSR